MSSLSYRPYRIEVFVHVSRHVSSPVSRYYTTGFYGHHRICCVPAGNKRGNQGGVPRTSYLEAVMVAEFWMRFSCATAGDYKALKSALGTSWWLLIQTAYEEPGITSPLHPSALTSYLQSQYGLFKLYLVTVRCGNLAFHPRVF
jgi:hypothetical protein